MSDIQNITTEQPPVVVQQQNFDTEALAPALNAIIKESKAGWKTTEFWVSIAVALLTVLDGIPLPEKFEGAVLGAIAVAYAISRGLAKQGVPDVTPVQVAGDADLPA